MNIRKSSDAAVRPNAKSSHKKPAEPVPSSRPRAETGLSGSVPFSTRSGDVQIIDGCWYVTHTGLIRLARRKKCHGIQVEPVDSLCDPAVNRFVFKAIVYPTKGSSGFAGYGDADPSNVSLLVRGAEMRVAETRAVNRALRKAYGIGLCSVEELGTPDHDKEPTIEGGKRPSQSAHKKENGNGNGFDGFAPASQWPELSSSSVLAKKSGSEVA